MLQGNRFRCLALGLPLLVSLAACGTPAAHQPAQTGLAPQASDSPRVTQNLNATWRFLDGDAAGAERADFADGSWPTVTLPHTWNARDGQDGGGNYRRGVGWYRRHLQLPASYTGKQLYLEFGGANTVAEVFVNGQSVGQHRGGYAGFRLNATSALRPGADNVIAVRVDNSPQADVAPLVADYTFFGGLYRGVNLLVTNRLQVRALDFGGPGVYLKTSGVSRSSANLEVLTKVFNNSPTARPVTVQATLQDASGAVVRTLSSTQTLAADSGLDFSQTATIASPHLWNGRADPYLYRVRVEVRDGQTVTDAVTQPLGFRSFTVDAARGFSLNGSYLDLHGVNRHQDRLDKGWAVGPAEHDEDFALIREMGANTVRLAHYQQDPYVYDLTDRYGLVVWNEIPVVSRMANSPAFFDNAKQQLTELIRQNFNHPSVMFWGIENEVEQGGVNAPGVNDLLDQLNTLARREDPSRLTTIAQAATNDPDNENGPTTRHTDLVGYNRYFGWYEGAASDVGPWLDRVHAAHPDKRIAMSEYGAGASVVQHQDPPAQPAPGGRFHPEEYQNLFHETYWKALKTRPFVWGKYVWNMFDFAVDGRNEGDTPGRNDKGLVTYDRKTRKDAFYWYKANWSEDGVVYITGRRNASRPAPPEIKVYANTDTLSLSVNGVSLGTQTSSDHIFRWASPNLKPGNNVIEAVGTRGGQTLRDSVTWTIVPQSALRLDVGSTGSYTDSAGRVYGPDGYFTGGTARSITDAVSGTPDGALLRSYRFGRFAYALPLENGTYDLYLKFVEPFWTAPGQRVFSVSAEGTPVLQNLDLFKEAGRLSSLEKKVTVTVSDGLLNLDFVPTVDNAILSGLAAVKR